MQANQRAIFVMNQRKTYQTIYANLVPAPICGCGQKHKPPPELHVPPTLLPEYCHRFALSPLAAQRNDPKFSPTFLDIDHALISGIEQYIAVFNSLLEDEYHEMLILYERYSQYNVSIDSAEDSDTATITIKGIHDARPALQPGDEVLLRPHHPLIWHPPQQYYNGYQHPILYQHPVRNRVEVHSNVVTTRRSDVVIINWCTGSEAKRFDNQRFTARFIPSILILQRCSTALNWLRTLDQQVAKDLLFPTRGIELPHFTPPQLYMPCEEDPYCLNDQQSLFVQMVLRRAAHPSMSQRPPMILTGPAGTGKTKALLVSILKTLEYGKSINSPKRILVCTPSHTAADVVSRRLGKLLPKDSMFRLYDATWPVEMVPVDILRYTKQGDQGEFLMPNNLLEYEVVVCTCSDAHNLFLAGVTNGSLRDRRRCLKETCETYLKHNNFEHTIDSERVYQLHFTHLYIDEAAQATEPETLIPFSVVVDDCPNTPKVEIALIGDPRQLSPNIYSPHAYGLQKSLLERLLRLPVDSLGGGRGHLMGPPTKDTWTTLDELIEYSLSRQKEDPDQNNLSTFLTLSYRGHPSFLLMPSKLFYFDKLKSVHTMNDPDNAFYLHLMRSLESQSSQVKGPQMSKQYHWPIHFRGVIGKDTSISVESFWGSNSWQNAKEAEIVLEIIQTLVKQELSTQSIGVMGAFRAQVVLIRQLLRENGLGAVNVGMVSQRSVCAGSYQLDFGEHNSNPFAPKGRRLPSGRKGDNHRVIDKIISDFFTS